LKATETIRTFRGGGETYTTEFNRSDEGVPPITCMNCHLIAPISLNPIESSELIVATIQEIIHLLSKGHFCILSSERGLLRTWCKLEEETTVENWNLHNPVVLCNPDLRVHRDEMFGKEVLTKRWCETSPLDPH